jgi:hypothetical protein
MPDVIDYRSAPLGSQPGEGHLQVPFNQVPDRVIVKVRNVSAIEKRRVLIEAVSIRRGGNEQLKDAKRGAVWGKNVNPAELQFRVGAGEDVNWYEDRVAPIDFVVRHDGLRYRIYAVDPKTGENAPWYTVDPGVWDLYCGNWERMHGSAKERATELEMLGVRGLSRYVRDPVNPEENPFGFLEFSREEIKVETALVDTAAVRSGKLIEV